MIDEGYMEYKSLKMIIKRNKNNDIELRSDNVRNPLEEIPPLVSWWTVIIVAIILVTLLVVCFFVSACKRLPIYSIEV